MGAVLPGSFYGILPHIVVFRVGLGFAAGNGTGRQTDGSDHAAHLEYQSVVALVLACVVFLHGDVPFFLHVPDELRLVPFSPGQQDKAGEDARVVCLAVCFRLAPLCDLLLALPDHRRGVLILRVQLRPPLGVGNGFLLLLKEILIGIGHPHVPLRLVLALLPNGLQDIDGAEQGLVSLVTGRALVMVPNDGVVFQRSGQSVGRAVVPPVLRDGVQRLDTAGVLVRVVPLLDLCEKLLRVFRGVRDIVHARQRLGQLGGLPPVSRLLLRWRFQVHRARFTAECVEAGPGNAAVLKERLGHPECGANVPGDKVHIAAEETGGPACEGEHFRAFPGGEHLLQLVPEVEELLASFFLPQGIQGIAEEARHRAVGMESVHEVVVFVQIAVDQRHTVGGTGDHIQPPIGVRVFIGLHFVGEAAV